MLRFSKRLFSTLSKEDKKIIAQRHDMSKSILTDRLYTHGHTYMKYVYLKELTNMSLKMEDLDQKKIPTLNALKTEINNNMDKDKFEIEMSEKFYSSWFSSVIHNWGYKLEFVGDKMIIKNK